MLLDALGMPDTLPPLGLIDVDTVVTDIGDVGEDFATVARLQHQNSAVVHNGIPITYGELAARVDRTAVRYRARRDGRSALVGVLVSHTPAVVEHLLAVMQAGATYCPIDAALPAARRLALAGVMGLDQLVTADLDSGAPGDGAIETIDWRATTAAQEHSQAFGQADAPAYVLCTSGSTGAPKPVMVSRGALVATVRALRQLFALTPDDRVLQFASLGWDTCLEEILPALTAGATLIFDDAAYSGSFPRFVRMLAEQSVTMLDLPTAFWHELVLYLHEEGTALPDSVRLVVIGGERVDPTRLRQWRGLDLGDVRLLNTYGCTETTMVTHAVQLSGPGTEPDVMTADVEAPLGRPLPHTRDHVTDDGELLVSGASLATGYLGLAERTAAGFSVSDHGDGPTRWFHTGDIVTRGRSGLLYAHGRVDEQVKVLGVRVHPAEVEAQLNAHPAVAGAVVVGERLLARTALVAYVVAAKPVTSGELKRHLAERLPRQFVPSRVKFITALSYTPSGKVDRAATRRAAMEHDGKGADQ
ncbi:MULTISPECIES: AMP-binding protein [unclassified Mycolicibacterium]|uniref:AMP-binding protein n=3 Tax=Mycolicibacterium TaxID=1866885 RepID=UPI002814D54D|nr:MULTISPECIES: AMP-binding protein [unclassified Mycolicibacterium]